MKKILIGLTALVLVVVAATAAQRTATVRDIERPRLLADILDNNSDELYAADVALAAADANLGTNAVAATRLTGNVDHARLTNAVVATIMPAYASGKFAIADTTQLVFVASGVTNVIDADITTP